MNGIIPAGISCHHCGYCRRPGDTSVAEGFVCHGMDVGEYQRLVDHRWRRCGRYFYRPYLALTCCPLQSIRLDCLDFVLSKSQRKCLRRLFHHLDMVMDVSVSRNLYHCPIHHSIHPAAKICNRFVDVAVQRLTRASSRLHIKMGPPEPTSEKLHIYRRYQAEVHGDDPEAITMESFRQFLCDSPLSSKTTGATVLDAPLSYGTWHLEYRVDGILVGVSVLDILPHCFSSVYFFYLPRGDNLSWGTLSSLIEIGLVRQASRHLSLLHYYYLGYYLGSCGKLAYKAQYRPSELLHAETLEWRRM